MEPPRHLVESFIGFPDRWLRLCLFEDRRIDTKVMPRDQRKDAISHNLLIRRRVKLAIEANAFSRQLSPKIEQRIPDRAVADAQRDDDEIRRRSGFNGEVEVATFVGKDVSTGHGRAERTASR
jgi:hypothetical protein